MRRALSVVLLPFVGGACGPVGPDTTERYLAATHAVLAARGVCASVQECTREERALWDGGRGRTLYLDLYGVTDPRVVAEVADSCARITFETPNSADVVLTARDWSTGPSARGPYRGVYRVEFTARP